MKEHNEVEILCIGTELLLGNILNSNAKWLAEELAKIGLPHYRQIVVGDNSERLGLALKEAEKRSRILITTGGLGPTIDDITHQTIADIFNAPLMENKEIWLDIKRKTRSKEAESLNRKQSLLPTKSKIICNPSGTAPGIIFSPSEQFTIITLPGVPYELKEMWQNSIKDWLKINLKTEQIFSSRVLKFAGISESHLASRLSDFLIKKNPTISPYAGNGEVKLRLTAKSKTLKEAQSIFLPVEKEIRNRLGNKCYGSDDDSLASVLINLLRDRGESLALAESCSGGNLGASLTAIPGASNILLGGVIAYSNLIKQKYLNVPAGLIKKYGAVSSEVAKAMAQGVKNNFQSDWGIAITGLAGPGGSSKAKPIGLVHFAIEGPNYSKSMKEVFPSFKSRVEIQNLSVVFAIDQLRLVLLTKS